MPLRELTEKVTSWRPSSVGGDKICYVDLGSVSSATKSIEKFTRISGAEAPSRARQLLRTGDVLVSTVRPNLNSVAQVPEHLDGATGSTGFAVLRPNERLDAGYLFRWVRSGPFVDEMARRATGASYPAVSDQIVKDSKIPLPPLEEQRRIAAILDRADGLRFKRRQVTAYITAVRRALFSELDQDREDAQVVRLGDLAEVSSGITKGRVAKAPIVESVPYLAVANVQDGRLDLGAVKKIDVTEAEMRRYQVLEGDLLLTEGGDPDKLGRGALWNSELPIALHQNHIFRVRVASESVILRNYLSAYVSSSAAKSYFLRSAKQTTGIASINMSQLRDLPVSIPSMGRQRQYVVRMEALSVVARKATVSPLDDLYAALEARAFRGEL